MDVKKGDLLRDYRGRQYEVWAFGRDPLRQADTAVLVECVAWAVLRDKKTRDGDVLTVDVADLGRTVAVDADPTGGGPHRKTVPAFTRVTA